MVALNMSMSNDINCQSNLPLKERSSNNSMVRKNWIGMYFSLKFKVISRDTGFECWYICTHTEENYLILVLAILWEKDTQI